MNTEYRELLIKACQLLIEQQQELFSAMLNLASAGPLKELSDAFEIGESFTFQLDDMRNTGDANLDALVEQFEARGLSISSLVNINGLTERELGIAPE